MLKQLDATDVLKITISVLMIITATVLLYLNLIISAQAIAIYVAVMGYVFGHANGYMVGYGQSRAEIVKAQTQTETAHGETLQANTKALQAHTEVLKAQAETVQAKTETTQAQNDLQDLKDGAVK
jgi:hypothetical protein